MERPIASFAQDGSLDWVALLDCGHARHMRHNPPLVSRPWVLTEDGRQSQIGARVRCQGCERFELPKQFQPYKKTPVFSETTVPAALLREHSTRNGVWAKIHVVEGALRYVVGAWGTDVMLAPEEPGVVVPEVIHRVEPQGKVKFFVEFYASPTG